MAIRSVYVAYDRASEPPKLTGTDIGSKVDSFKFCPACGSELEERELAGEPRLACPNCEFVRFRNPTPTLSVLVNHNGRTVLGKRKAPPGEGKWAFPSGYIEYDEDFITAACREFQAETGLDVKILSVLHVASSFLSPREHFFYMYLYGEVIGGELKAGDDLARVDWFPLAGPLPELAFQEDADVIEAYLKGELNGIPIRGG